MSVDVIQWYTKKHKSNWILIISISIVLIKYYYLKKYYF